MIFAIKMLLITPMGYWTSLNLNVIILIVSLVFQAESKFKNYNFGGKFSELLIQDSLFPNKFAFGIAQFIRSAKVSNPLTLELQLLHKQCLLI